MSRIITDRRVGTNIRNAKIKREKQVNEKDDNIILVSEYDPVIFFSVLILMLIGIIMIFSASYYDAANNIKYKYDMYYFLKKQIFAVSVGMLAMIVAAVVNYYKFVQKFAFPLYIISCGCLVYVRLFCEKINGAYRWMELPFNISFQPSELAKVAIILLISKVLYDAHRTRTKGITTFFRCMFIIAVPIGLVYWGKNLSTAIIIAAIGFGLVFITSRYYLRFFAAVGVAVTGLITYLATGDDFRAGRFAVWQNPFIDPLNLGYQPIQSLYAVASGGLFGLGLGNSRQKLEYMPEPHNDFIFAIICEELGFVGASMILFIFAVLIWRTIRVAINSPDLYGSLVASGIAILLGAQVIINVAVVTNTIPNTGIPLPFISYGGTSIAFLLALMGVLLNISRCSKKK